MSWTNVHATAVRIGELGVLIRGPARSGKSALALSCLRRAETHGLAAALVSDDQVLARLDGARVGMDAPASISGLIEVSGVGLLREAAAGPCWLSLLVDLREPDAIERLPENAFDGLMGVRIRRIFLPTRQAAFGADVLVSLARNGVADLAPDAMK